MDDAHIIQLNIMPNVHIFGVFDGHGGDNSILLPILDNFIASIPFKPTSFSSSDLSK